MKADQRFVNEEDKEPELDHSLEELEGEEVAQVDRDVEEERPLAEAHYLEMVEALGNIIDGHTVDLDAIADLSSAEREALEYLKLVVSGRTQADTLMYAEDRLEGLNQVLAQLQPVLSVGGAHQVLRESLHDLVDDFDELREHLRSLEDAQEEVFHVSEEKGEGQDAPDEDDKPDQPVDAREEKLWKRKQAAGAAKDAAGEAAGEPRKSSLSEGGPEAKPETRKSALADGPEVKPEPRKSALAEGGPEAKPEPRKSALADGPAVPDKKPAKSTAWDPDDRGGGER